MGNKHPAPSLLPLPAPASHSVQKKGTVHLTHEQARDLLTLLDSIRLTLENQVPATSRKGRKRSWLGSRCVPAWRRYVARYILLITAVLQSVNLMVVSIIDIWPRRDDKTAMDTTGVTMLFLQVINLFFIVMVSVQLAVQVKKHQVSVSLMAQSYVSTLLLFAGCYTLTYRLQPRSWKLIEEELEEDPILVIVLYCKFLFFSVSTATLCGSDNVLPKEWYNCLFTALQMLMSFVYFASILGQTLSEDTQYWLGVGTEGQASPLTASNTEATDDDHHP